MALVVSNVICGLTAKKLGSIPCPTLVRVLDCFTFYCGHLSVPEGHLLEFGHLVFGSDGGGTVGECDRLSQHSS